MGEGVSSLELLGSGEPSEFGLETGTALGSERLADA